MVDQATNLRKKIGEKIQNTRIIAVASGKGGVGKTNLAVNLGLALQQKGQRVLLLDADLGMANIDILLGLTPRYNLSHLLKGKCRFEDALLKGPGGINILPGTSGIEDLINISSTEVKRLMEVSARMEDDYDVILIDVGAGIHYSVTNFIMASDEALIILTPEPTSIMDAYSLIKYLFTCKYKNSLGLIINQTYSRSEGIEIAERMKRVIKEYLQIDINIYGYVPYDMFIPRAVKDQVPFILKYADSKAVSAINEIADRILDPANQTEAKGMKGFVNKIVGIFNRN